MEILLVVLLIVISVASKSRKNSQAAVRAHQRTAAARPAPASKPQPAAVASPKQMQPKAEQLKMEDFDSDDADSWDGSIEMAPETPHTHEGKDASCPEEERAKPRPHPALHHQEMPDLACDTVPGLTLNFSNRQSLVQGVIMGEVLRRPEFKNGRRVIH